jgi:hypothetical protein
VHGENEALQSLADRLQDELTAPVTIAKRGQIINLMKLQ